MASLVWKFFSRTMNDEGASVAQCNTCNKVFLRREGNTTAMWRHLTRYHPGLHAEAKETSKEEQEYLKLVAQWIVSSNQPFSAVENPSFLKMMGYNSRYKTPSKYLLTKKILPEMENETKMKIRMILKDQRPSLTADVSESGEVDLVAITAHFVDAEYIPRNAILGARILQDSHTSDNIRSVIEECLLEYGISESAAAVTTDAAATMTATVRKLGKANIHCCAHQIHLAVTDALSQWALEGAVDQCRKFARLLHKSSPARKALRKKLDNQNGPNKCPIRGVPRDCNVRWNSTYLRIQAVVEKIDYVNEVLDEFRKERIADEDVLQLKKAVKLLGEFYFQTLNLCQDFTPATEIIPILSELISYCDSFIDSSTGEVVDLAISLRTNVRSRLTKYTSDINLLSLMTLDPRFAKDPQFIPSYMNDAIKEKLTDWFKPNTTSAPPIRPINGASNKFKRLIAERDSQLSAPIPSVDLEDELERYLAELTLNKVRMDANPMDWWKAHQFVFPNLALAAREALALQATSVQSERLFSKIGLLYQNKLRNRLQGESAQRCALIACADMSDIARQLSCQRIPSASLRNEGEALQDDEIDGDYEEEEEGMERGMEGGMEGGMWDGLGDGGMNDYAHDDIDELSNGSNLDMSRDDSESPSSTGSDDFILNL